MRHGEKSSGRSSDQAPARPPATRQYVEKANVNEWRRLQYDASPSGGNSIIDARSHMPLKCNKLHSTVIFKRRRR